MSARAEVWTEVEEAIGKLTLDETLAEEGRLTDPLLQSWVDRVGGDVCRHSSRKHIRYRFYVSAACVSNAYSLPGGYVVVTSGLLNHVSSDEELAGVIAHEIAHSDDRDFERLLREQLLFLGLQSVARGNVKDGWIVASQFLQLLEGLRSSRRHEAQADYQGARLCLLAAYDPNGLVDFLDTIGGRPHGLDKLFATHPPGPDRVVATRRRVAELERSQYPQLVALAQSLQERHHLKRAAAVAASAMEYFPAEDAPRCLLNQLEQQRSSPESGQQAVSLPDDLQAQAKTTLGDLRGDEQELYKAEQALRTRLGAFYADQQIATALQYAQVLSPELDEVAYVSTLARAYWVMSRAAQEAQRQGEVAARGASVRLGWERVAKELVANKVTVPVTANSLEAQRTELQRAGQVFVAEARPAVQATTAQVKASTARCGELTTATRMVAGALLALLASGREQPLGRLTYAHFLLLQGDILAADQRLRRSEKASEAALHTILGQHLRVLQVALTATHATAGPALRELDLALTAARVGATPPELAAAAATQPFGEAVFALLEPRVQAKALAGLQVRDCLLRIAYLDVVAER